MSDFEQRSIPGDEPTVLLLHGTGGDENDLLSLGQMIAPGSALLGVRGKVLENGAPRFFRRLKEGVFDLEDLRFRTNELADFLVRRGPGPLVALGYSNGANIAASILMLRPEVLSAAILFRAMVPIEPDVVPDLKGKDVFMGTGIHDPIIPLASAEQLASMLKGYGADVTMKILNAGHGLVKAEVEGARAWLADVRKKLVSKHD